MSGVALTAGQPATVDAAGVSAIGNEAPLTFAISPLYAHTHMLAAVTAPVGGCTQNCMHLWISRDGGGSWRRSGGAQPPGGRITIVPDQQGRERIVAAAQDGVMASVDGDVWQRVGDSGNPAPAAWIGDDAIVVAGQGSPDYVASAGTVEQVPGSEGLATDLAFSPTGDGDTPALLVARDPSSGLPEVMTCDAVAACRNGTLLPGASPRDSGDMSVVPAADYATSRVVYARTNSEIFASSDGGRHFLAVTLPPHVAARYTTIPAIAVDPRDNRTVYAALLEVLGTEGSQVTAGGIFVSHDAGTTWQSVGSPGPLDGGATTVTVTPDDRLFAGYVNAQGGAGLVCSDGDQWQAVCAATPNTTCRGAACTPRGAGNGSAAHTATEADPAVKGGKGSGDVAAAPAGAAATSPTVTAHSRLSPTPTEPPWLPPLGGLLLASAVGVQISRLRRARR